MTTPVSSGSSGTRKPYGFEPRPYGWYFAETNRHSSQGTDSVKPYGTPHHPVQQAPHAMRACVLALFKRRARCRAREAGIDRGDGIATDGGREVVEDKTLADAHEAAEEARVSLSTIIEDVLPRVDADAEWDDDDLETLANRIESVRRSLEGIQHNVITAELVLDCERDGSDEEIVTDGGKRVAKAPIEDDDLLATLEEAEEEHGSLAEAIRAMVREYGDDGDRAGNDDVPAKALDAYRELVGMVGREAEIDESSALSLIAQRLQIDTAAVKGSVMKELRSAGYLSLRGSTVVVHQEPGEHYDEATGHHDIVSFQSETTTTRATKYGCRRCGIQKRKKAYLKTLPCEVVEPTATADAADAQEVPADD